MRSVNRPPFIAGKQSMQRGNTKVNMATKTDIRTDFKNAEIQGRVTQQMIGNILKKVVDKMKLTSRQENAIASSVNRLVNTEFNSAVNQAIDPQTNKFDQSRLQNKKLEKCHGKTPDPKSDADACIMDICGSNKRLFDKQGINEILLLNELRGAVMQEVFENMPESKAKPTASRLNTKTGSQSPTLGNETRPESPTSVTAEEQLAKIERLIIDIEQKQEQKQKLKHK
ncbi:MAG: hypothetical protein VXX85_01415 [Candidatus Margulisiibacteriota bacterium]|nr:hypothetical protein [Candidatus Margulisiibacteriota bacterium]